MKRSILNFFVILICFVIQTTVIRYIAFAGICPNIMLVLPILMGFLGNERDGIYAGFFTGLLFDAFYANVLGINAFLFMIAGYLAGMLSLIFNKFEMIIPIILIAITDFVYGSVNYGINFLLHRRLDVTYYYSKIIMPELVYTVFVSILLYRILMVGFKFVDKGEERTSINKYVI